MKKNHYRYTILLVGGLLMPSVASAQQDNTNRLTFSARLGFHISATFKGFSLGTPPAPRNTPRGDAYNYDNGYVLTDISGNFGGQTWYWGYDNSASQISGNSISFDRSTVTGTGASSPLESEPYYGAELTYNRELGRQGNLHYGVEVAANYMNFTVNDNSSFLTQLTDIYAFTPGTTPPTATPAHPYQGSYGGPGFVIDSTPARSITTMLGNREFDTDLWGFRLGPYLQTPLCKHVNLSVSGGMAVGLLDSSVTWTQTSFTPSGRAVSTVSGGNDFDVVWGGYVSAALSCQFDKHLGAEAGVQFQDLGTYNHSFNGQNVELDLRNSLFVTFGLTYGF